MVKCLQLWQRGGGGQYFMGLVGVNFKITYINLNVFLHLNWQINQSLYHVVSTKPDVQQGTMKKDSNPTSFLFYIASTTNTPPKNMFCSLLKCFDSKIGELKDQVAFINTNISELNSAFVYACGKVSKLEITVRPTRS